MDWGDAGAVLFDLDGVLTSTAAVHMRAWEAMFRGCFAELGVAAPYTDSDYFEHVDGRSRVDGVRSVLASRGVHLPDGAPSDAPGTSTVHGLGNAKNAIVEGIFAREGVRPYEGSVHVVHDLAERGVPMAVVSSSQNAVAVLAAAGFAGQFPVVVDGVVAAAERLPGKPAPDMFLLAAERLGVPPGRAVVVEDAVSGVAAGAAGGFGLVVGVDRGAGAEPLRAAGAHLVVPDLEELLR
jgi:beta-phosphoglucomutase family hydrolase